MSCGRVECDVSSLRLSFSQLYLQLYSRAAM